MLYWSVVEAVESILVLQGKASWALPFVDVLHELIEEMLVVQPAALRVPRTPVGGAWGVAGHQPAAGKQLEID